VDNPAGITTILEAMAMGKAVIATATAGQRDVVRGRLCTRFGPSGEPIGGPFNFGFDGDCLSDCTGLYVPPGDPAALRSAIEYLLSHPNEAREMGAAGRRLVEQHMTLDQFVVRVAGEVKGGLTTKQLLTSRRLESVPHAFRCQ
jgi:glycosyltransferase involved in cell wall biosynthesis